MVQVFHNPNFHTDGFAGSISSWGACVHVADVITDDLGEAYMLTQNDYAPIHLKELVALIRAERIRSTSAGDILVRDGEKFFIEAIGFRKIEDWELVPDPDGHSAHVDMLLEEARWFAEHPRPSWGPAWRRCTCGRTDTDWCNNETCG
jgi:hypothetical protein